MKWMVTCSSRLVLVGASSLVDPAHGSRLPVNELLGLEPQSDLLLSGLDGIGSVADVAADLDAVVPADGAGLGVDGVGLAEHDTTGLDDVEALPDHGADGTGSHVLDESGEERASGEVGVVLLQMLLRGLEGKMSFESRAEDYVTTTGIIDHVNQESL